MGNLISCPDLLSDKDNAREKLGIFGIMAKTPAQVRYLCDVGFERICHSVQFIEHSEYVFMHPFDPITGESKGPQPEDAWLTKLRMTKKALEKRIGEADQELVVKEGYVVSNNGREVHVLVLQLSVAHLEPWTDEYKEAVAMASSAWKELVSESVTWKPNNILIESKEDLCGMFMVKESCWSKDGDQEGRMWLLP